MFADVISQIASIKKVHYQVQVLSILKGIVHVDNKRIVKLSEDLPLVHDRLDAPFSDNSCLGHLLHRVCLLRLLSLNFPNLSETAFANAILVVEVCFRQGYRLVIREIALFNEPTRFYFTYQQCFQSQTQI